jgi:hypothetical protein
MHGFQDHVGVDSDDLREGRACRVIITDQPWNGDLAVRGARRAEIASVLQDRLANVAGRAHLPGDRAACQDAAQAAARICQLMARGDP